MFLIYCDSCQDLFSLKLVPWACSCGAAVGKLLEDSGGREHPVEAAGFAAVVMRVDGPTIKVVGSRAQVCASYDDVTMSAVPASLYQRVLHPDADRSSVEQKVMLALVMSVDAMSKTAVTKEIGEDAKDALDILVEADLVTMYNKRFLLTSRGTYAARELRR
uniref:Uncharacterized protein n=1 Tax=viral metagenome TaxID=1070528 RepID=A0A6M3LNK5_9ZZZZ